jgi:hypothetical protein
MSGSLETKPVKLHVSNSSSSIDIYNGDESENDIVNTGTDDMRYGKIRDRLEGIKSSITVSNMDKKDVKLYPSKDNPNIDNYSYRREQKNLERRNHDNYIKQVRDAYRKQYSSVDNIEEKLKYIPSILNAGEKCTRKVAKDYNIYNDVTIFKKSSVKEIDNIRLISNDHVIGDKQYSVCDYDMRKNLASENCALQSPFLSSDPNSNKCKIKNGVCPNGFVFKNNKCVYKNKEIDLYEKDRKSFCDNKWYDWFKIPNFHLNNGYQKYRSASKNHDKDVTKCYKPCGYKHVPLVQDKHEYDNENMNKCIKKTDLNVNMYNGIDYCPIALIHLLGIDKETLYRRYTHHVNESLKGYSDLRRDSVYNKQKDENSSIIRDAMNDIVKHASDFLNTNVISEDIVELGMYENTACNNMVKKEDIEVAYNICEKLADVKTEEERNKFKDDLRSQYGYNQDNKDINYDDKFAKHMRLLCKACNVSFNTDYSEPDVLGNKTENKTAKRNLGTMDGQFSNEVHKPLNIDEYNKIEDEDKNHDENENEDEDEDEEEHDGIDYSLFNNTKLILIVVVVIFIILLIALLTYLSPAFRDFIIWILKFIKFFIYNVIWSPITLIFHAITGTFGISPIHNPNANHFSRETDDDFFNNNMFETISKVNSSISKRDSDTNGTRN